ncbi:MAG: hypothetical protein AABX51_06140 [Nanoarchaeota archaeon]
MFSQQELVRIGQELLEDRVPLKLIDYSRKMTIDTLIEHASSFRRGRRVIINSMFSDAESPLLYSSLARLMLRLS